MSDSVAGLSAWRHRARGAGDERGRRRGKTVAPVVAAIALGWALLGTQARPASHAPRADAERPRCPAVATVLHADVDGDGCDEEVTFGDGVLTAGPLRMRVGAPGDQVARGPIVMELDPRLAPNTVNNFVSLARDGYYDGLSFHRVVPEFVIQGGDPEGSGSGGPGYRFADEPVKGEYTVGAVAMANAGPDTNGSQFFICIDDCRSKLQKNYNHFGYVIDGMDIAQSIQVGDVMRSVSVTERDID